MCICKTAWALSCRAMLILDRMNVIHEQSCVHTCSTPRADLSLLVFCGMNPMTNSRNCACQQSSVNRRDQGVLSLVCCTRVRAQTKMANKTPCTQYPTPDCCDPVTFLGGHMYLTDQLSTERLFQVGSRELINLSTHTHDH